MKHPTRWVASGVAVVVVILAIVLASQVHSDPRAEERTNALTGHTVPAFALKTLDGTALSKRTLSNKAVIVNFWNTWCIPCEQEFPALRTFYSRHATDPDFEMVGIVRDDTAAAVRDFVAAKQVGWKIAMDPGLDAVLAFGVRGQPETFAISPDGTIVDFQYGPSSIGRLEQMLSEARAA